MKLNIAALINYPRWLKHKSCNVRHQQQVVIKCAIQLTQNQCKKCATQSKQVDKHVKHNRHKLINNMIHLDKHMCMYQCTMYNEPIYSSLFTHTNSMHMYTFNSSFQQIDKHHDTSWQTHVHISIYNEPIYNSLFTHTTSMHMYTFNSSVQVPIST